MPIRPDQKARYPKNWKAIVAARHVAAGGQCEYVSLDGVRCTAKHHVWGYWADEDTGFRAEDYTDSQAIARTWSQEFSTRERKYVWIVLTVAHILNDDPADVRPENLQIRCQRHHNRHDAKSRAQHAVITRRKQQTAAVLAAGQQELHILHAWEWDDRGLELPPLRPCPFCGGTNPHLQNTAERPIRHAHPGRLVYYACVHCKAIGPDMPSAYRAALAWNGNMEAAMAQAAPRTRRREAQHDRA